VICSTVAALRPGSARCCGWRASPTASAPCSRENAAEVTYFRPLSIAEGAELRLWEAGDATELTEAIAADREHLATWLPWAETQGFQDSVEFLELQRLQVESNDGFDAALLVDGEIAGGVGFHRVDWVNRSTSIGYWLAADAQGRGLMTAAVTALLDYAFFEWELHRVIIEVVVGNERSQAIPERLGFRQEAILRQAKLVRGSHEDTRLYAMLAPEWVARDTEGGGAERR
jgi:ribosomal-protein-serine acetyltransferase